MKLLGKIYEDLSICYSLVRVPWRKHGIILACMDLREKIVLQYLVIMMID